MDFPLATHEPSLLTRRRESAPRLFAPPRSFSHRTRLLPLRGANDCSYEDALIEVARVLPMMQVFIEEPASVSGRVVENFGLGAIHSPQQRMVIGADAARRLNHSIHGTPGQCVE